jgi:small conductance mechanosensitive channel
MQWKDKVITYLIENGPKIFGAVLIIVAGVLLARWLGALILRWLSRKNMEPPVRMLITRLGKLLVTGFALVIALGTMGFNITALVAGIGVAGVGISLATQGVLSNIVAGLTIIFTKPFRVGEYIELINVEGQVATIELFSTTLTHPDRSRVVIPNRRIVGEVLHNYGTIRQLSLTVGVAYRTDLTAALAIAREVVQQNPRVLKEHPPVIGIATLADSSISIFVRPWVAVPDYGPAGAEIYQALIERFRAADIEIPFPQREIRLVGREAERLAVG